MPTAVPNFLPALPEMFLGAVAMALLLVGAFRGDRSARATSWLAVAAILVTLVLVLRFSVERRVALNGMFVTDGFGAFMKALVLAGSAFSMLLSLDYNRRQNL